MATAKQTYFLNADKSKAVGEGDPASAFLLVRAGGQISDEDAEKYGVELEEAKAPEPEQPSIVVSGGVNTGAGVVKGELVEDQPAGEELPAEDSAKKATKKGSKK
jgi:hypothetical protein